MSSLADLRLAFWGSPADEVGTLQQWQTDGVTASDLLATTDFASLTKPSSGATVDTEARAAIDAIIDALKGV